MKMVLTKIFEEFVNPAFHSGNIGLASKGFGTTPSVDILVNLQRIYRKTELPRAKQNCSAEKSP